MMSENWIVCRDCNDEFNAEQPQTKAIGFYNQCLDCAEEAGDVEMVKGFINTTQDGDFDSISVVDAKTFEKLEKIKEETGQIGKKRG